MKRSYRRHRNPQIEEQNVPPFFSGIHDHDNGAKPFFASSNVQMKGLTVGKPGDKYEKEADAMADKVVNHSSGTPPIHKKEISSIQRATLATPTEDEKLGTAEQRMEEDKLVQEKPEPETMGEKEEEEMPLQEKHEEEDEEVPVQTKSEAGSITASPVISNKVLNKAGRGKPLAPKLQAEMGHKFGADFRKVNIHTDQQSIDLNKKLHAQAFTHGQDIYFNAGKYNPETGSGKHLLAHELTHVIQQTANLENAQERTLQKSCEKNSKKSYYESSPNYCKDTGTTSMLHKGQTCFRQVPYRKSYWDCPPGDQVCFDSEGNCHDSWDKASPVESKDADGSCNLHAYCSLAHTKEDKVIETWWDIYMNPVFEQMGKQQSDCIKICETQPWYLRGFCLQGCNPVGH